MICALMLCCCCFFRRDSCFGISIIAREFNILFIRIRLVEKINYTKKTICTKQDTLAYIDITVKMLPLQYLECKKWVRDVLPLSFIVKYDFIQDFWSVHVLYTSIETFVDWHCFNVKKSGNIVLLHTAVE